MSKKRARQPEPEVNEDMAGLFAMMRYAFGPEDAAERAVLLHSPGWLERAARDAGRLSGRREARREDIVAILEHRFGKVVAAEFVPKVHELWGPDSLSELLRLALVCDKTTVFRNRLKELVRGERCRRLIDETA